MNYQCGIRLQLRFSAFLSNIQNGVLGRLTIFPIHKLEFTSSKVKAMTVISKHRILALCATTQDRLQSQIASHFGRLACRGYQILSQDYFAICDFYCVEIIYILDEDCF